MKSNLKDFIILLISPIIRRKKTTCYTTPVMFYHIEYYVFYFIKVIEYYTY